MHAVSTLEAGTVADAAVTPLDTVYLDGAFVSTQEARVSPRAHALSYGTGTFEGMRAIWNEDVQELFLLEPLAHYERMARSAAALGLALPHTPAELIEITIDLLRRNDARADTYVRPLLILGGEALQVRMDGISTRFSITLSPFPANYIATSGVRCLVSSWRRQRDDTLPIQAKVVGSYVGPALAKTEAVQAGFDEAIMLNAHGYVAEATTSNLFIRRGGAWITPAPSEDILEGITRREVIELVEEELGEHVMERSVNRTELYICEEALLCGTAVQVVPLLEVDRRSVGNGAAGERTLTLAAALLAISRRQDQRHPEWTVPVWNGE